MTLSSIWRYVKQYPTNFSLSDIQRRMHNEIRTEFRQLEIAPTLSAIERLLHDRGYRDSRGLFFIEGVRNFIEAVDHRFSVDTLLYSEKLLIKPLARKLVR